MKVKIKNVAIVRLGVIGQQGDCIAEDCEINHKDYCTVTRRFNPLAVVGQAGNIRVQGKKLLADLDVCDDPDVLLLAPAISAIVRPEDMENKVIKKMTLTGVGLTAFPVDGELKRLGDYEVSREHTTE